MEDWAAATAARVQGHWRYSEKGIDFRRHLSGREGRLDALVSRTEVVRVSKGLC
jgi:hypothetical protein